jgi:TonB family protein
MGKVVFKSKYLGSPLLQSAKREGMSPSMAENILIVEYEPRYSDQIRNALQGQPFTPAFARDGEEAIRVFDSVAPRLVVLSSVLPKTSVPDLIRTIRERNPLSPTPILLMISGYTGKAPKQDAARFGVTDLLPKPFTDSEFVGKVQQLVGFAPGQQLTSNDIFGDVLEDHKPAAARKQAASSDLDKMLAEKLGVSPRRTSPGTTPVPPVKAKSPSDIDKLVHDTLSGLEKKKPPAAAQTDRVHQSQPVFPPPAAPDTKPEEEPTDGVRFGSYVLLEKIATGGMAEVWKARKRGEEGFQKIVAIKKILPHLSDNQDFIEMFIDEAKLAAQLNHNNIIHIYDLGKIQSSFYIAMEYIDGHDLKTILRQGAERDQPLGVELSLFIASKIAAALDYAHRKRDFDQKEMGLVHRDVSPQNVLVSQDGDIKLCDFGIAKAASKASHTQAGALKGKLQYMSPEQAWGKPIDRRSDIFALGAVLSEMLTGKRLFTGDNEMSILEQVREARVTPPSQINEEVTPEIDAIVLKALKKEPGDRYQTAGDMAKDIESVLYTFKPTPTSADLAIHMNRIWMPEVTPVLHDVPAEVVEPPKPAPPVAAKPAAAPVRTPTAPGSVSMPAWDAKPVKKKRSPVVPLAVAGVLVAAIVGGFLYVRMTGKENPAVPQVAAASTTPAPSTAQAPVTDTTMTLVPAMDTATTTAAPTTTTSEPVLDPSLVNQEVQKRLAAERARLDEQMRLQRERELAAAAPVTRPAPQPQPPPQPAVITQTTAPAPVPVPQPTEAVAEAATETAAPPPPPPPAPAAVREGDLVPAGTPGLVPARVLRFGTVPYPPIARQQRVEGEVLVNVLVSESGQVLDIRILRPIARSVGLNEAAEQIIRRSTFSAPTKDGVRVKAWTAVPVRFRL